MRISKYCKFKLENPSVHAFYLLHNRLCPWMLEYTYKLKVNERGNYVLYVYCYVPVELRSASSQFALDIYNCSANTRTQCEFYS